MTSSRPEPRTVEERVAEMCEWWSEFNISDSRIKTQIIYEIKQAVDEARAEALEKFKSPTTKLLLDNAYAQGFSEGATAMRERAARLVETHDYSNDETPLLLWKIRALPLSESHE